MKLTPKAKYGVFRAATDATRELIFSRAGEFGLSPSDARKAQHEIENLISNYLFKTKDSVDPDVNEGPNSWVAKNKYGLFQAFHYGCLIGVFETLEEAEQAIVEKDKDDHDFEQYNLAVEDAEMVADNPGYRSCNCEDYPCCGH